MNKIIPVVLVISASAEIASALIRKFSQDEHVQFLLHVRPGSADKVADIVTSMSEKCVMLDAFDLMGNVNNNEAYKAWFDKVMETYKPSSMIIATGGSDSFKLTSVSTNIQLNAIVPVMCCEQFIRWHDKADTQEIKSIYFMNSIAADMGENLGSYGIAKSMMRSYLKYLGTPNKLHKQYKHNLYNRYRFVDYIIGPVDTELFRSNFDDSKRDENGHIVAPGLIQKLAMTLDQCVESMAKAINFNQTKPGYEEFYVSKLWRTIKILRAFLPLPLVMLCLRIAAVLGCK